MAVIGHTLHWGYEELLEMDLDEFEKFNEIVLKMHEKE